MYAFPHDHLLNHLPHGEDILLTPPQAEKLNTAITRLPQTLTADLSAFPRSLAGTQLAAMVLQTAAEQPLPEPFSAAAWISRCLPNLPHEVTPLPALMTECTALRSLPCNLHSGALGGDGHFDLFSLSALRVGEPLVILCRDKTERRLFVHCGFACGWIPHRSAAVCGWDRLSPPQGGWVVTEPTLAPSGSPTLTMGTHLPAADDKAGFLLPRRGTDGHLYLTEHSLPPYGLAPYPLPFTQRNFLCTALKLRGYSYRWSGLWDCSALIRDVCACFGLRLPRNIREQRHIPCRTVMFPPNAKKAERLEQIRSLPNGSLLYMNGHGMIYLGLWENRPMILHSLWEARLDSGRAYRPHKTVVTHLDLLRTNGESFVEELTCAKILWQS